MFHFQVSAVSSNEYLVEAKTSAAKQFLAERIGSGAVGFVVPEANLGEFIRATKSADLSVGMI